MRIFVTGASGFVGSAVVQELVRQGHHVTGLIRSEAKRAEVEILGATPYLGQLEDPASLRRAVDQAEAIIHTGFNHDFSKFAESCENDRRLILAFGEMLRGSSRPLIVTSGIGVLEPGLVATENSRVPTGPKVHPRTATEIATMSVMEGGVRAGVVRLPPSTHGAGDHGFVPILIELARQTKQSVFIEDGSNRWPAVHRLDAAKIYVAALERPGFHHAVAEAGLPFREIAAAIGRGLGVPVLGKSRAEAAAHFGWFAHFAAMNVPATSEITRRELNWSPREPDLMSDMANHYFS